ncbi:MAG: hypothetical protein ACYCX4_14490 [Bacillota bacterium]
MDRLVVTTVTIGKKQLSFVKSQCDNVSRYIRSLIDREIGAEKAQTQVAHSYQHVNSETEKKVNNEAKNQEPPIKATVWSKFPR